MEIERCDCSEFERREDLIPCDSLMAGQVSSLKGKPMSSFLVEMDQREYEIIKSEEAQRKAVRNAVWENVSKPLMTKSLLVLVASIISLYASFQNTSLTPSLSLAALSCFGILVSSIVFIITYENLGEKIVLDLDIDDNRLARLQNKVGVLEDKIATENEYKEQFRAAKDFFKTKYDIYLGQRNRPITNVTTYVHSMHSKYKKA